MKEKPTPPAKTSAKPVENPPPADAGQPSRKPAEFGGPADPEPTRYRDWERNGRVSDF